MTRSYPIWRGQVCTTWRGSTRGGFGWMSHSSAHSLRGGVLRRTPFTCHSGSAPSYCRMLHTSWGCPWMFHERYRVLPQMPLTIPYGYMHGLTL
ncbi:hypothetical protein Ahy_B01g053359 isoform B [Arachis hypogaea]|uniref:Uncharacterized protein n=1 Tax=Arachis hypogaea TaxID=3818 RepID=A0A445ARK1_ARAHY|nr:hypothetical protein Ahy_B01g053359 isoform B [Arachis hypogaea]